jgi:hypothetical protein
LGYARGHKIQAAQIDAVLAGFFRRKIDSSVHWPPSGFPQPASPTSSFLKAIVLNSVVDLQIVWVGEIGSRVRWRNEELFLRRRASLLAGQ